MGTATIEIQGHIASINDTTTKTGKRVYKIMIATGKSERRSDGSYDNSNQAWWELSAWGDYATKLALEGLQKGEKIRAIVRDPKPHIYQAKDGRMACVICATLWNHTLSRVIWMPKNISDADSYTPSDSDSQLPLDDFDPSVYEPQMV